jgi:hypothetical protein
VDFEKLELSTETLRDLTDDELRQAAGGMQTITPLVTGLVPSGATWFKDCDTALGCNLTGCYTC